MSGPQLPFLVSTYGTLALILTHMVHMAILGSCSKQRPPVDKDGGKGFHDSGLA